MQWDRTAIGIAATLLFHGILGMAVLVLEPSGSAERTGDDATVTIEASLAFKATKIKTKQPQKLRKQTFKDPDATKVSRDEEKPVVEEKPEEVRVKPDEIDPLSVLDKHRIQDEDRSDTGALEEAREGSDEGSDLGTGPEAVGHPYTLKLMENFKRAVVVPKLNEDKSGACGKIWLSPDGTIVRSELKKSSEENDILNQAILEGLKNMEPVGEPVPIELTELLVEKGVCFRPSFQ